MPDDSSISHRRIRCAVLFAAVTTAAAGLSACSEASDPNRPLTVDEGATLLKDIRSDQSRMQSLTPAERQYLIKTMKKK